MFDFLKQAFGRAPAVDYAALLARGALLLDVRGPDEFLGGHIEGARNIPLQTLPTRLSGLGKDLPIITCCASGARSATAKRILEAAGFPEVHNGGGWRSLQARLRP